MKYNSLIFVSALALTGLAQAAEDAAVSKEEESDIRVECIETAIADELEDDQKLSFVQQCVEEKIVARRKSLNRRS